jgi:hypothetical protein
MATRGNKEIGWLYSQLPTLVSNGILTENAANAIRNYYGELPPSSPQRALIIIFSILGSALIGGGIILVLAHNWENFNRSVRAILSIAPLLLAQVLAFYAVAKRSDSVAWKESTGLFLSLMIGASIALVSQTYHLSGNFRDFMLTWLVLSLPVIYLIPSTLALLFYLGAFQIWTFADPNVFFEPARHHSTWQYWLLLAAAIPYIVHRFRRDPVSWQSTLHGYFLILTLTITAPFALQYGCSIWIVFFSGLMGTSYCLDHLFVDETPSIGRRPYYLFGTLGSYILIFILSFRDIWGIHEFSENFSRNFPLYFAEKFAPALLLYLFTAWMTLQLLRRKADHHLTLLAFPVIAGTAYIVGVWFDENSFAVILINLYGLILGIVSTWRGVRHQSWAGANMGLALVSALILARFFDSEFGLLQRGIVFVVLGAGFLGLNLLLLKQARRAQS